MRSVLASLLLLIMPFPASAWESKGHLMINRLAIEAAAAQLPEFMNASREQLIYNAFEPDRWRKEEQTPLTLGSAPDHFFNSERWGSISTIDADRYSFMEKLAARKIELARVGYLPYAIVENYGRLVNAFRFWRNARTPRDRETARANAVFYAGVLGHYVGDGSEPLHLTIHYNGWAENTPNPKDYTKDRRFHSRYEGAYVDRAVEVPTVKPKVQAPQPINDVLGATKQYLIQTFAEVEPLYQLEKTGEFNPDGPRAKGTDYIANEIARAATMLGQLWYTAWLESGEPLPVAR